MEKFSETQLKDAREFAEFYIDLIENHNDSFIYHLSDEILLDWFGQTVKGVKNITVFLKTNLSNVRHHFPNIEPCHNIGYRESHVVKYSPIKQTQSTLNVKTKNDEEKTPPNNVISPGCSKRALDEEQGQGDGVHNGVEELSNKKMRLEDVETKVKGDACEKVEICNITSNGHIEFRRKSSKKYQRETKWSRPCRFQVAYSKASSGYLIHLIIYQGNMKCRRNLLKDFEAAEQED